MYECVCVCVCVCEGERERKREKCRNVRALDRGRSHWKVRGSRRLTVGESERERERERLVMRE